MNDVTRASPRIYVPGYAGVKALLALLGLALAGTGLWQLWPPARSVLRGHTAVAEVVQIIVQEPGYPVVIHDIGRDYPQDLRRRLVFGYAVEIPGQPGRRTLNLKNRMKPQLQIGDAVRVTWNEGETFVYAILDLRTWAVGVFLLIPGLIFAVAFMYLFRFARKPIELPDDLPAGIEL